MDVHWNIYCFKYNQSWKLRKINNHMPNRRRTLKQNIFHSSQASLCKHSTVECSFPFKNCTYCSSFETKYIMFIPLTTKTLKHPTYLHVFKRHRRATKTNINQEPFAKIKAQTHEQTQPKPLVCWGTSEGFQNKLSIKRNYSLSSLLFTQAVIQVSDTWMAVLLNMTFISSKHGCEQKYKYLI